MSFAKYHKELEQILGNFKNEVLKTSEILSIFEKNFPGFDVSWVHPSDHCINHTCKGACVCSQTDEALFRKVEHGYYEVL